MSSESHVENVLIVLSPLSQAFMRADTAMNAASELKKKGAKRADLTVDPRLPLQPSRHLSMYPVTDFTQAARNLSRTIFAPMLGRSDVQDFSNAVGPRYNVEAPDLFTLSHVGSLFARAKHDGGYLGLALYTALHGRSFDKKPYTHLLYPDMTQNARKVLAAKLGGKCLDPDQETHSYGVSIDLKSVRERIGVLVKTDALQPASRLQ